jgi:hypothetical protein
MKYLSFMAALLAGTFLTGGALAATIDVSQGESIQAALDRARPGDTVAVHAGTYYESITFRGSSINLKSVDGVGAAHIVSSGTPLFVQGGSKKEVSGFRLTAGSGGNGIQLGGSGNAFASGYTIKNNVIVGAGEDGIKAHQLDNSVITNNEILNAGMVNNRNKDGGIDFVAVRGTDLIGNKIHRTGGNSCLMLKGGSTDNDISGNDFGGCKNAVHVGGLTDNQFMAPGSNGREAYDNSITGNRLASSSCAIYQFDGEQRRQDNEISGNTISQSGGCSTAGGGGSVDTSSAGSGGTYSGDSYDGGGGEYGGMTPTFVSSSGGGFECSASWASVAVAAVDSVISMLGGGRASQLAQGLQIKEAVVANFCAASMNDRLNDQLAEQRRMTAGIGRNAAGSAGGVSSGVRDTLRLSQPDATGQLYQDGASADLTAKDSLAYHENLRARTDEARRNALETAEINAAAEKIYSTMADDALALSQSAQGQTAAQQAQTQMDRAREGAASARTSTALAFDHARLMTEEEERAGERMGVMRRDRLYRSEPGEAAQPFKLFQ